MIFSKRGGLRCFQLFKIFRTFSHVSEQFKRTIALEPVDSHVPKLLASFFCHQISFRVEIYALSSAEDNPKSFGFLAVKFESRGLAKVVNWEQLLGISSIHLILTWYHQHTDLFLFPCLWQIYLKYSYFLLFFVARTLTVKRKKQGKRGQPNSFDFEVRACPAVYDTTFYVTIETFYPVREILGKAEIFKSLEDKGSFNCIKSFFKI